MDKKFIVETSARHIHLSKEDLETLFGDGYQLTNKKNLSQPGQFACEEKVTVVGAKGEGTEGCKLVGPAGEVELSCGVIAAKRHIHMTPADAKEFGVVDKEIVSVKIDTDGRSLIFGDVVCRVSENYATAMHIDTDESNAAGCGREVYGTIVK